MKFSVDKQEKYTIFSLQEETLNSVIAPDLKSELVVMRNEGVQNLILNFEAVKFVDSSGLSAILTANRLWKGFGTCVITGIVHQNVKKLIEISKLNAILNIVPTIKESVDFIFMEEIERELNAPEESDE